MKNLIKKPTKSSAQRAHDPSPALKFTPTAWAKLIYLRDLGDSEVGGFGISAEHDPLLIEDIQLVEQTCTPVSVVFDDGSVADFFDRQVDLGRNPHRFARAWVHTHPGSSAQPSITDEETFERVFGGPDWAVMFILAQDGETYARLRLNVGPGAELKLPVEIDYTRPFAGTDHEAWDDEYLANVRIAAGRLWANRGWWAEPGIPDQEAFAAPGEPPQDWLDEWDQYAGRHESLYVGEIENAPDS